MLGRFPFPVPVGSTHLSANAHSARTAAFVPAGTVGHQANAQRKNCCFTTRLPDSGVYYLVSTVITGVQPDSSLLFRDNDSELTTLDKE